MGKKHKNSKNKQRAARRDKHSKLAPVVIVEVTKLNEHGEAIGVPAEWENSRKRPPYIILDNAKAPSVGDTALVKVQQIDAHSYSGQVLKLLPKRVAKTVAGVYQKTKRGGLLEPVSRKQRQDYFIADSDANGANSGDIVIAELLPRQRNKQLGLPCAKVIEDIGDIDNPKSYSILAIHHQDIPVDFPAEAIAEAELAVDPVPDGRIDLRDIALLTIDGADARDFDDAVFAEPDDSNGEGGWHLLVAIADVAHYVKPDSALDKEGLKRGNSVYFPDRVVPMLPEALSNGLCSLNPDVDRYCLAVHMWIDPKGNLKRHKFVRGIMRSHYRLTYEQAQNIYDVKEGDSLEQLKPLYGAYETLLKHRNKRGALELDLPEYNIVIGDDGHVAKVEKRKRLDSHKLIEEFMVTANIAAALELEKHSLQGVYRVHEPPSADKVESLRGFLKTMEYSLNDAPTAKDFNGLFDKVRGTIEETLMSSAVLRSQMQAVYLPENLGHFGLGLSHYAHFTSPIRRYSDLITHRAICSYLEKDSKARIGPEGEDLAAMADHISSTERRAMLAEREARDRYITAFMAEAGIAEFEGFITSVGSYGVFVTLSDTGASGIIRIRDLGRDYYTHEESLHCLIGRDSGERYQLGQRVVVTLKEADVQLGSLSFNLVSADEPPSINVDIGLNNHKPRKKYVGKNKNFKKRKNKR